MTYAALRLYLSCLCLCLCLCLCFGLASLHAAAAPEGDVKSSVDSSLKSQSSLTPPRLKIEAFDGMPEMSPTQGYLARFLMNSPADLKLALMRAEALFEKGVVKSDDQPLVFVVHGPEVGIFLRDNYSEHKEVVDLAAKLSAFGVIDVRVCRARLGSMDEQPSALPPFVKSVPFGPAEIDRLVDKEKYVYF